MKIGVLIGSIRQGRRTSNYAAWVLEQAKKQGMGVTKVDLADYELPLFDEPVSPKYNQNRQPAGEVKRWLDTLAELDGYVIVSPEYNRSIPGALKNALDYVAYEMAHKPVAIISHGSYNGAFAMADLRIIMPELEAVTIPAFMGVSYGDMQSFTEDGTYTGNSSNDCVKQLTNVLTQLQQYAEALKNLRS